MEKMETATTVRSLTPKDLAKRLGIGAKRLRMILREQAPRDIKKKRWEIPLTLAKKVEKDFKANVREREAKKQAKIKKQLEGKE